MSEGHTNVPSPPRDENHAASSCPSGIREVLSLVGNKWSMLVLSILSQSPVRFNELRRNVHGISQRMLTRTLRELERSGLVSRTVTPTTPPSVEYALTELGKTLIEPVNMLVTWTQSNYDAMSKAQHCYDKSRAKK